MKTRSVLFSVAAMFAATMPAHAAQIVLTPGSVYASSGDYSTNYSADNIFDAQSGAIFEPAQDDSYWLNPDNGPANAFISIDLGGVYQLTSFDLFNTHNAFYNDRGTGSFSIVGSNSASFASFTTLAVGTLAAEANNNQLTAQSFASQSGGFRYLQFRPTSVSVSGSPCCGANVYGLNELRIFGSAVPEPATWMMMILGFGLVGGAMRRRKARPAISFA